MQFVLRMGCRGWNWTTGTHWRNEKISLWSLFAVQRVHSYIINSQSSVLKVPCRQPPMSVFPEVSNWMRWTGVPGFWMRRVVPTIWEVIPSNSHVHNYEELCKTRKFYIRYCSNTKWESTELRITGP